MLVLLLPIEEDSCIQKGTLSSCYDSCINESVLPIGVMLAMHQPAIVLASQLVIS